MCARRRSLYGRAALASEQTSVTGEARVVARLDVASNATNVSWMLGRPDSAGADTRIEIDAADRSAIDAVTSAARIVGVVEPVDTRTRVTIVFPSAADRDALTRRATRLTSANLIDLVARVRADPLVASALNTAEDTTSGARRLLVFSNDSVASVRTAALIGAIRRALSVAPGIGELDPATIPASVIASWQRAPDTTPTRKTVDSANGPSDGRWLWVLVLALIGVESWLRRERRTTGVRLEERAHDRAA